MTSEPGQVEGASVSSLHGGTILIITLTDLQTDPMPYKQINHLRMKNKVVTIGTRPSEFKDVEFHPLRLSKVTVKDKAFRLWLLMTHRFERYYDERFDFSDALKGVNNRKFDAVIAHDDEALPLALRINEGKRVVYDAHEYTPTERENNLRWRLTQARYKDWLCREYLSKSEAMVTVSNGIAKEYERNYGVRSDVIINSPEYQDLRPTKVSKGKVRLVHHGIASPQRRIEDMIRMAEMLDERFSFDLFLLPLNQEYRDRMRRLVEGKKNIRVLDPVPMQELVVRTNPYDLGLFMTYPSTFNLRYSLPNKFFEYIQARLAVAIGPYPELSEYVRRYDCGIISESFEPEDMANALNSLTEEDISKMKGKSDAAARELTAERSMKQLDQVLERVMRKG